MSDLANAHEEIRALKAHIAGIERAAGFTPEPPIFTTAQVADRYFYTAHRAEIMLAAREGRIIEPPEPEPPEPVEYPPTGDPRLTQIGPGIFSSEPLKER
jgi:hypothetical protein